MSAGEPETLLIDSTLLAVLHHLPIKRLNQERPA